jgi:hypothetical protein
MDTDGIGPRMRIGAPWAVLAIAGVALGGPALSGALAATPHTHARPAQPKPKPAMQPSAHAPVANSRALKFRPPRGAAAAEAKGLGALVGKDCTGRADMQRNERQWVVLCSNGRTFVVEPAASKQAAPPPIECSLAGTGPEPACFP